MLGLGSSSSLGIGLAVYLDDKFTNPSKRLTNQVHAMGMSVNQFKGHVRTLEVFAGGVFLATSAVRKFAEFDKTMSATAIIGGISKTSADYKLLVDQTMRLSSVYGQLPAEIALTNLELAKAGKSVPDIIKLQEAVTALGAATDTKVGGAGGAAEMLVNTMQAFNAASNEGMKYADIMTSAANRSTIDVTDLYESLKYSSDAARSLNIPFQEAAVAIATLGNAGLKGSMAGVAYANMLRYIATGVTDFGTKKQQKVLASWGLTGSDFRKANGNLKELGDILEILRAKTSDLSDPDKIAGLTALFGVRGARGLVPLMTGMTVDDQGRPVQTYEAMQAAVMGDVEKGVAKSTALERINNLAGDFDKLRASWNKFLINMGARLAPAVSSITKFLTKAIDWFDEFSNSEFGAALTKSAFVWIMAVKPLKALFAIFGRRLLGAGASFVNSFRISSSISTQIGNNIRAAANYLVTSMLRARNISMMGPGGITLMGRGPGGRLTGSLGRATVLTKIMGALFGRAGLRWLAQGTAFFARITAAGTGLSKFIGFLGKSGAFLKGLGLILGRVVGWLFGWPAMLADIGLTLITGKGIFEWLWEGIKWLGGILYDIGNWFVGIKDWFTSDKPERTDGGRTSPLPSAPEVMGFNREEFRNSYNQYIQADKANNPIHITINPTTGDRRTEYFINGNAEKELISNGIKH